MGYYCAMALCALCDETFTFNPERVPCFPLEQRRGPPMSAHRFDVKALPQPVCQPCFEAINRYRAEKGLEPVTALPGAWEGSEAVS